MINCIFTSYFLPLILFLYMENENEKKNYDKNHKICDTLKWFNGCRGAIVGLPGMSAKRNEGYAPRANTGNG